MSDEWELDGATYESLSDVLGGVFGSDAARLSANQQAARAWYAANGDVERAHTCGVFLKKPRRPGDDPVLGVYVDSPSVVYDFGTNKEIYLTRLHAAGLAVSGIDFKLSRYPKKTAEGAGENGGAQQKKPLPPLSATEQREVAQLAEKLPPALKDVGTRAIELSFRRQKGLET